MRVKRGKVRKKRHKKILKATKGYRGSTSKLFRSANQAAMKAGRYAYKHRRTRKREFRALWIVRINAACREHGISYSVLINSLLKANINVNRKILADIAVLDKEAFKQIVETAKKAA